MTFEEALEQIQSGKKVRRDTYTTYHLHVQEGRPDIILQNHNWDQPVEMSEARFGSQDVLATDWIVVP